jgi:hypothetical protein
MKHTRIILAIIAIVFLANCAWARGHQPKAPVWVASWAASQQIPETQNTLAADDLRDATVRQIFRLSVGGPALRVHLSNAFGTVALHFTSVHVARPLSPSSPEIDPASDRPLTFAGSKDVTVPPGAEFVSDSLEFAAAPLSDIAVTFHLDAPPARETGHPGSRATSYYQHGDNVQSMWTTGTRLPGLTCRLRRARQPWWLWETRSQTVTAPRPMEIAAGRMS